MKDKMPHENCPEGCPCDQEPQPDNTERLVKKIARERKEELRILGEELGTSTYKFEGLPQPATCPDCDHEFEATCTLRCVKCGLTSIGKDTPADLQPKHCTEPDDMQLPEGKTCNDCRHIKRCEEMFGVQRSDTMCDWSPSRFEQPTPTMPLIVYAVVYSNYDPTEVDSLWWSKEEAETRCSVLGDMWEVETMAIQGKNTHDSAIAAQAVKEFTDSLLDYLRYHLSEYSNKSELFKAIKAFGEENDTNR